MWLLMLAFCVPLAMACLPLTAIPMGASEDWTTPSRQDTQLRMAGSILWMIMRHVSAFSIRCSSLTILVFVWSRPCTTTTVSPPPLIQVTHSADRNTFTLSDPFAPFCFSSYLPLTVLFSFVFLYCCAFLCVYFCIVAHFCVCVCVCVCVCLFVCDSVLLCISLCVCVSVLPHGSLR